MTWIRPPQFVYTNRLRDQMGRHALTEEQIEWTLNKPEHEFRIGDDYRYHRSRRFGDRIVVLICRWKELEGLIRARYPEATFGLSEGKDPAGTYLRATVDVEDLDEVRDLYSRRVTDMEIERRLPLYVYSVRARPQALQQ
jgi:hypothetical protein